jgi:hypothetical protein
MKLVKRFLTAGATPEHYLDRLIEHAPGPDELLGGLAPRRRQDKARAFGPLWKSSPLGPREFVQMGSGFSPGGCILLRLYFRA